MKLSLPKLIETYFGLQLGLYGQYINLLSGENYTQFDYTGGFNLSEKFFLGINATTTSLEGDAGFSGVALYPQLALSDSFSVGLRGELFRVSDGSDADDLDTNAFTITGSFSSGNLIIKPEFRIDTASSEIFGDTAELDDNILIICTSSNLFFLKKYNLIVWFPLDSSW